MAERRKTDRKKLWSMPIGPYGFRIRLSEYPGSGIIYAEMRDPSRPGRYISRSLRHRDRARAIQWAKEQVAKWQAGHRLLNDQTPTLSRLFSLYLSHQTPTKVESEQHADHRRAKMWARVLGGSKDLSRLSLRDWQHFTESRRSGFIDAKGELVEVNNRVQVRAGTVAGDLVFLISVMNWACRWRIEDHYLMQENPARGFPIPTEKNPRRPVVTDDRYEKVRAAAARLVIPRANKILGETACYLPEVLDIAWGTGRRLSAILSLRYSDLRLADGGPYGSILWPADTDKTGKEWLVPMSADVRTAINRVLRDRPGVGSAFLFPALTNPSKPISKDVVAEWLRKAETLACVPKHEGSAFHAYRRGWATRRKHLPVVDVARAGGWSDQQTLTTIYQQPDAETMYMVVSQPARLVDVNGSSG